MLNQEYFILIRLAALVLLPVVPAFLLFKALPSKAIVSGPLQGLTINMGGAFAGYFVILLVLIQAHTIWNPVLVEVWSVDGTVLDENGSPFLGLQPADIRVNPPPVSVLGAGKFRLEIATQVGPTGDRLYPSITVSRDDLRPVVVPLEPQKAGIDKSDLKIDWNTGRQSIAISRMVLSHLPAYNSASAQTPTVQLGGQQ